MDCCEVFHIFLLGTGCIFWNHICKDLIGLEYSILFPMVGCCLAYLEYTLKAWSRYGVSGCGNYACDWLDAV